MPETTRASKRTPVSAPARRETGSHSSVWHRIGRGALVALAAIMPWFFLPLTASPASSARLLVAALAATIGLVALLADTVERRRLMYPGSLVSLGVLAVVVATAIAAFFSQAATVSFFGGLLQPDSLMHIIIAAVLFVLAAVFLNEREDYARLTAAFIGGVGLASLLAILGFVGVPYLNVFAPGMIAELGYLAVLALGIACLAPLSALPSRAQVVLLGSATLSLAALILMNYRILWVAVALIALFAAAAGFVRKASITVPLALSLIALVFVLVGPRLPSFVNGGLELRPSMSVTMTSIRSVLTSSHTVVGTGPGTYSFAFSKDYPKDFNNTPFWNAHFDQGMSYLFTTPVTTGLLGTVAWLILILGAIQLMRRKTTDGATSFAILVVGLTGIALLIYPGSFVEISFGAIALGALVGLSGARRELAFSTKATWPLFATFLVLIVVTAGSLAGMYLVGQRYAAAAYFYKGSQEIAAGNTDAGITHVAKASSLDSNSDLYVRGFSQALLVKFQQMTTTTDQRQAQQMLQDVVQAARRATELSPNEPANWANLGGVFEGLTPYVEKMDEQAITAYNEAEKRQPHNPAWPLARARTYAALAQFQHNKQIPTADAYSKAQSEIARSLDLKADYVDPRFLSAQLHFLAGENDQAMTRVQELRAQNPNDSNVAFQLGLMLYQSTQYQEARNDFERAVSLNSNFANARYFLGLTYSQLGMRNEAIAQFQQLIENNKDNKELPKILDNLNNNRPALQGLTTPAATSSTSTTPAK